MSSLDVPVCLDESGCDGRFPEIQMLFIERRAWVHRIRGDRLSLTGQLVPHSVATRRDLHYIRASKKGDTLGKIRGFQKRPHH